MNDQFIVSRVIAGEIGLIDKGDRIHNSLEDKLEEKQQVYLVDELDIFRERGIEESIRHTRIKRCIASSFVLFSPITLCSLYVWR